MAIAITTPILFFLIQFLSIKCILEGGLKCAEKNYILLFIHSHSKFLLTTKITLFNDNTLQYTLQLSTEEQDGNVSKHIVIKHKYYYVF